MNNYTPCTLALQNVDDGYKIQVTIYTTWIPMLIAIAMRMYIRRRAPAGYGLDDYLMLFAVIPISIGCSFHLTAVHYGLGRHFNCLDDHRRSEAFKFQFLGEGMNIFSIWIVKLSICFFLLRLIKGTFQKTRLLLWALIVINSSFNIAAFVVWACAKIPINSWWNPNVKPVSQIPDYGIPFLQAVFIINVIIDFIFALSPIYFLWDVRIPRVRKYTLWMILMLAILPSVVGLVKVVYLKDVNQPADPTYSPVQIEDLAALIEQNAGTFIANLPCLGILFERVISSCITFFDKLGQRVAGTTPKGISLDQRTTTDDYVSLATASVHNAEASTPKTMETP